MIEGGDTDLIDMLAISAPKLIVGATTPDVQKSRQEWTDSFETTAVAICSKESSKSYKVGTVGRFNSEVVARSEYTRSASSRQRPEYPWEELVGESLDR